MRKYLALTLTLISFVCLSSAVHSYDPGQTRGPGARFRRSARPVPGQYIVVFDDERVGRRGEHSRAAGLADELVSAHGGAVMQVYKHALQGFSARLSEAAALALSRDPRVAFVEENAVGSTDDVQTLPVYSSYHQWLWGLDRIDQRDAPSYDQLYHHQNKGSGVRVYVIDSGIRVTHAEFGERASVGVDTVGGQGEDCFGHGTHVAGTVGGSTYGVAKDVKLIAVRVSRCTDDVYADELITGIDWVTAHRILPAVANVSIGFPPNDAIDAAVRRSIAEGVVYVVSAGNEHMDASNRSPARVQEAFTVAASTLSNTRSSYSNYGPRVDMFAPGDNIISASNLDDYGSRVMSGTSMAAPHVAGVAALELESNPAVPPKIHTTPCRLSDGETGLGAGSPNELLFARTGTNFCSTDTPCQWPGCRQHVGWLPPNGITGWALPCGSTFVGSNTYATYYGTLNGPVDADLELTLMKEVRPPGIGAFFIGVASNANPGSCETVTYYGAPGSYYWRVRSKSGGGNYTLTFYMTP